MKQFCVAGFTLIELLTTLAVVAIVLTMAVPSLRTTIQDNEGATQVTKLMAVFRLAQSEAVKRNLNVSICQSADGASCGGTWTNGWIAFVNNDNDNPAVVDAGELILRVHQDPNPNYTWTAIDAGGNGITSVTYRSLGIINSGFFTTAIDFKYCDSRGASQARAIAVNFIGHTEKSEDGDANGIHEDASGTDLTCP